MIVITLEDLVLRCSLLHFGGHFLGCLEHLPHHGTAAPASFCPLPTQEVVLLDLSVLPPVEQPPGHRNDVEGHRLGQQEPHHPLKKARLVGWVGGLAGGAGFPLQPGPGEAKGGVGFPL